MRVGLVAAVVAGAQAIACTKAPPHEEAPSVVRELPVPAPEGWLADAALATPDATWKRLQRSGAGPFAILPSTLGEVVCALSGVDSAVAAEVDGAAPAYAVLAGDPHDPSWALAVKLVDPRRARAKLVGGRFAAREVAGLTALEPAASPNGEGVASLALSRGGYLVVARSPADRARLGPYASRTLTARGAPSDDVVIDVPHAALTGALRDAIAGAWNDARAAKLEADAELRRAHGGRAPDFADPPAIVATASALVDRALTFAGDLARARVTLDVDEARTKARITAVPSEEGGPAARAIAALPTGALAPLVRAPADAAVAFVSRASEGPAGEHVVTDAIARSLGARLGAQDRAAMVRAADLWDAGQGAWIAGWGAPGRGLTIVMPSRDDAKIDRALREAAALARVPAFRDPLRTLAHVRDVRVTPASPAPGGATVAWLVPLVPPGSQEAAGASERGAAWRFDDGELRMTIGASPAASTAGTPRPALATVPEVARAVDAIGERASFAMIVRGGAYRAREGDAAKGATAPAEGGASTPFALIALGRDEHDAFVTIDASTALLTDAARAITGF